VAARATPNSTSVSAADMGDLDARDTDKHRDAMEFRWS
jgi:hypothetical protein